MMKNLLVLIVSFFFCACSIVPITGRCQCDLISDSSMRADSLKEFQKVKNESPLSKDREKVEMVQRVGQKIAAVVDRLNVEREWGMEFDWEFILIDDDSNANAWCMAGGKIAVYTGVLKYTQNEDGLAVVMGHEVAHALARHVDERMSHGLILSGFLLVGSVALEINDVDSTGAASAVATGATVGVLLPFSRSHESEADRIGLQLMARAGYNPREAIAFWERMAKKGGVDTPTLLSTHPSDEDRIADIKNHLAEADVYYRPKINGRSERVIVNHGQSQQNK